ncbi:anti-sigma factor [Pseudomonas rubra]|uniref:Anti-sigma factor n=1 Tax=Pseudomonas rubra TaxID=2942627 RepID=A0ABT5P9Y3_9PSED|nr:anti-sigma factor [Pseudomonas rubra]MDD1015120.1 anti-sigma factor [Pseudomonas rubra]MDD1037699.1 anti-sigma factor [Pseudomonas rubra]MDD1157381.1 anti-sigma factor [Pseudomonas rubra]
MNDEHDGAQDELDTLAAEYVLGTLAAGPRTEVEQRLGHDAELRAAVDAWEQRLEPLGALAPAQAPSAGLWRRIERSLGQSTAPDSTSWWNRLALWRGLSAAGLAATLILGALLLIREVPVSTPSYLVVLVAPLDKSPGWVIQASDQQSIRLIPLGVVEVPQDKALQFWTKGKDWQAPVSLGLVKPGQTLQVPLDSLPPLESEQLFELTLEGPNGSATGKPTGPIQFIGRAVKVL